MFSPKRDARPSPTIKHLNNIKCETNREAVGA